MSRLGGWLRQRLRRRLQRRRWLKMLSRCSTCNSAAKCTAIYRDATGKSHLHLCGDCEAPAVHSGKPLLLVVPFMGDAALDVKRPR